jgi:excisionase family DNA binding protein
MKNDRETKLIAGKEYLTSGGAASYLGISKVSVLNYAKTGAMSCLRMGSVIFFKKEWLDDYIDEKTNIGNATDRSKLRHAK